jgi:valyl-tRNA synthetase
MSKTLGNVIDPLEVMNAFGTDALRLTLLTGSTPGNDMNLSLERVEANRNFANKLWNAGRLVVSAVGRAGTRPDKMPEPTLADRWIRARLAVLLADVARLFEAYQYGEAGRQVYDFFWGEYADWYLETAKLQLDESPERAWSTAARMVEVLDACLRLLHPFTPFVTEELWGRLRAACQGSRAGFMPQGGWEEALIVARWPEPMKAGSEEGAALASFGKVMDVVKAIRNARAEKGVEPSRRIPATISAGIDRPLFESEQALVAHLARLDPGQLAITDRLPAPPEETVPLIIGSIEVYLPLAGLLDAQAERARLQGEIEAATAQIMRLETLLGGAFAERAPANVVEKERAKLGALKATRERLVSNRKALGG